MHKMRIGHGYDVHRFGEGDHVMLGGVKIPHSRGLLAHSDGDVLIHALCDALLGAAGMGDIGKHFPDNDERYSDVDSRVLLRDVMAKLLDKGWQLSNADITLVAQAPRVSLHTSSMQALLSADLDVDTSQINIKATTTEKLGFLGREEGIAAHAVVLLQARQ